MIQYSQEEYERYNNEFTEFCNCHECWCCQFKPTQDDIKNKTSCLKKFIDFKKKELSQREQIDLDEYKMFLSSKFV